MKSFELESFDDFLAIACQQSEPQRLLLVLAQRELPHGHTDIQAQQFADGIGGHLAPLAAVDKLPNEFTNFADFVKESQQVVKEWDAVFVAALPGSNHQLPSTKDTDQAVENMLHAIRNGIIGNFLVFDSEGYALSLNVG